MTQLVEVQSTRKVVVTDETSNHTVVLELAGVSALTASEVKTLYESNPDTNAFTDVDKAKVADIPAEAIEFPTRAAAATASIRPDVTYVWTAGFAAPGDGGHALYKKATTAPGHPLTFQSIDGAWWDFAEPEVHAEQVGMKADGQSASAAGNAQGIADAIAWIGAKGGGRLRLGPGRYKLNASTVANINGIEIIGANRNTTILDYADAVSTQGLQLDGNIAYFRLEDFQVQNADLVGVRITDSGGNPSRAEIRNVSSKFNGQAGFYFEGLFLVELVGCHAQGNGGYGFNFAGYHTTINAENSQAIGNANGGWRVFNTTYSSFDACAADQNTGHGWELEQVVAAFNGCGAESNGGSGFRCIGSAGSIVTGVRASMDGCFAYNNDSGGTGGNFLAVDASAAAVVLGLRACADTGAVGGRSVNVTGVNAITFLEGCSWAGTKSLAGTYVENQVGDLTIGKTAPALKLVDGADEMRMILSGGIGYLQGANGRFYIADMYGQDLVELKARFGGVYRDILRSDTGVLKAGDTMTGPLTLPGDPTNPLEAATKRYADLKLALTGGTLTGDLSLDTATPTLYLKTGAVQGRVVVDDVAGNIQLRAPVSGQKKILFMADDGTDLAAIQARIAGGDKDLLHTGGNQTIAGTLTVNSTFTGQTTVSENGNLVSRQSAANRHVWFKDGGDAEVAVIWHNNADYSFRMRHKDAGGVTINELRLGPAVDEFVLNGKSILHVGNGLPLSGGTMAGDIQMAAYLLRFSGGGHAASVDLWDTGHMVLNGPSGGANIIRLRAEGGVGLTAAEIELASGVKQLIHAGGGQTINGRLTLDTGVNDAFALNIYGSSETSYLALGVWNSISYLTAAASNSTDDTILVLRTALDGTELDRLVIQADGTVRPGTANTLALGSLSYPWATVVSNSYRDVNNIQVVGARRTGWAAATGTATRTTFDTASVTLAALAERVKALLDDLTTHGLIGA